MHLFIDKPFPCMKSKRNRQWAIIDLELQRNDIRLNIFEYMFTYCLFECLQNIMLHRKIMLYIFVNLIEIVLSAWKTTESFGSPNTTFRPCNFGVYTGYEGTDHCRTVLLVYSSFPL